MNTKVDEGKLISGKEALIALGSGEEVEFKDGMDKWENIKHHMNLDLSMFLTSPDWMKFRLKPHTITINGIEVPSIKKESAIYRSNDTVAIVCESFEEAELMCLALRQVFGGSHDN